MSVFIQQLCKRFVQILRTESTTNTLASLSLYEKCQNNHDSHRQCNISPLNAASGFGFKGNNKKDL